MVVKIDAIMVVICEPDGEILGNYIARGATSVRAALAKAKGAPNAPDGDMAIAVTMGLAAGPGVPLKYCDRWLADDKDNPFLIIPELRALVQEKALAQYMELLGANDNRGKA